MMDELLQNTVDILIDLDEPEALVATLQRAAKRRKGERWQALAEELFKVEIALNARQQPDAQMLRKHLAEWSTPGERATGASQPQPTGADHDKPADPAAPSPATGPAASPATAAS
jgi:hypothetical protein